MFFKWNLEYHLMEEICLLWVSFWFRKLITEFEDLCDKG